jgi:futalosine hydrolase
MISFILQFAVRILVVFAAEAEAEPFRLSAGFSRSKNLTLSGNDSTEILVTGVGAHAMAFSLLKRLAVNQVPDLVINAGIAGSFDNKIPVGSVVAVNRDCFGDIGIESPEGFVKLTDTRLSDGNLPPFLNGYINAHPDTLDKIPPEYYRANGVTCNTVTGTVSTAERLKMLFNPHIETMEGATFFYICARLNLPYLGIRAISNMVEPGRKSWDIKTAVQRLAESLNEIILIFA